MPPPVPVAASCAVDEKKSGRLSRSIRVSATQLPKISARLPTPTPNVTGNVERSEKPWPSSVFVRPKPSDHVLLRNTLAVGMNQRPVSPEAVEVAGPVFSDGVPAGADWGVEVCAAAGDAIARAPRTARADRSRLTDVSLPCGDHRSRGSTGRFRRLALDIQA
jgi:hypothetical protein